MGTQALALLAALNAACDGIDQLAAAIDKNFRQHPDYAIITSFPGLAARVDLGACVISSVLPGEFRLEGEPGGCRPR